MRDQLLFGALPYLALALFVGVSVQRYRKDPFTFSSLSSQFLEGRRLFWGSVPFHVGILTLFFGHLIGFLVPRALVVWNRVPLRLFIFEASGLVAALLTLIGFIIAMALAQKYVSVRRKADEQWRQSYEQLQAAGRLITGAENAERRRIGRDIDNDLGQLLNGMRFDMTWLHKRCSALPNTAERREIIIVAKRFDVDYNIVALQFAFLPSCVKSLEQAADKHVYILACFRVVECRTRSVFDVEKQVVTSTIGEAHPVRQVPNFVDVAVELLEIEQDLLDVGICLPSAFDQFL